MFYLRVVGMPVTKQHHKAGEPWLRQSLIPWWARIHSVPKGNSIFTDFSGHKNTAKNILYSLWTLQIPHTSVWKPPTLGWVLLSLQVHCEFYLPILHTERPICKRKLFWQRLEKSKKKKKKNKKNCLSVDKLKITATDLLENSAQTCLNHTYVSLHKIILELILREDQEKKNATAKKITMSFSGQKLSSIHFQ